MDWLPEENASDMNDELDEAMLEVEDVVEAADALGGKFTMFALARDGTFSPMEEKETALPWTEVKVLEEVSDGRNGLTGGSSVKYVVGTMFRYPDGSDESNGPLEGAEEVGDISNSLGESVFPDDGAMLT